MPRRVGVWFLGAGGNVATTAAVGRAALARGLAGTVGLVTELPAFAGAGLGGFDELVLGGHELRARSPVEVARALARDERLFPERLVDDVADELAAFAAQVRPGVAALRAGERDGPARVEAVRDELAASARAHALDRVVVVNLASTEPPPEAALPETAAALRAHVERGGATPASVLYALAALGGGHGYVNFTPSTGASLPALEEVARAAAAAHAGRDGKTGQTLVKSALAPMFAARNLRVRSWFGQNILGNEDGRTLADPGAGRAKAFTKARAVPSILGYPVDQLVRIDYVPGLGDWKVAWDHIQFEGFLGARMSLELSWHGADSALAAPLVLDLVRLVDRALRRGQVGALGQLALFFKDPVGCDEHRLERQLDLLLADVAAEPP
jgi:myo-inositol-1-phosphate synthase